MMIDIFNELENWSYFASIHRLRRSSKFRSQDENSSLKGSSWTFMDMADQFDDDTEVQIDGLSSHSCPKRVEGVFRVMKGPERVQRCMRESEGESIHKHKGRMEHNHHRISHRVAGEYK